jgi:hypothetical protein
MTALLNLQVAAKLLCISPWTLRKLVVCGKVRPIRIGRRLAFQEAELERFVETSKSGPDNGSTTRTMVLEGADADSE